ncbi:MAG: bifunctional diguanylate cyclase/phosphodiesterase [Clostridia bacterium]
MEIHSSRILVSISELLAFPEVTQGMMSAHFAVCEMYEFDVVRTYTCLKDRKKYELTAVSERGNLPEMLIENFGVKEYNESILQEILIMEDDEFSKNLTANEFFYIPDFSKFRTKFEKVGYTDYKENETGEAIVRVLRGGNGGIMGFFIFERYKGREKLLNVQLEELELLVEILANKLENYEARELLKIERLRNSTDALTKLPVLKTFVEQAEKLLLEDKKHAIMYLDIDKFKYINEMWSHEKGDEVLCDLANEIVNFVQEDECCCRIVDDKFAVLFAYNEDHELCEKIANLKENLDTAKNERFSDVKVTFIGGIYKIDDKSNEDYSVSAILDKANIARLSSKGNYDNSCVIYDQTLENMSERERQLENRTGFALANNEFIPFLQPKFDINTNKICGAEALARWKMDDRLVSPMEFIPVFEKNGFILRLDFAIYEGVFKFLRSCIDKGYPLYPVSVNVSRGHIKDHTFKSHFKELMSNYDIPKELIELEVTESVFMNEKAELIDFINSLRADGFVVSIDDFGTAYSSLGLLRDVEVDVIKMDKSFIDNIADKTILDVHKDKVVIRNIVTMIEEINFKIIFEGIETIEQIDFIKELGCSYGQGYIFSKPLPIEEYEEKYLINN